MLNTTTGRSRPTLDLSFLTTTLTIAATLVLPSSAFAFDPSVHRGITKTACQDQGLPSSFCERVSIETGNVDAYEFDDLAAHAQMWVTRTPCNSASSVVDRLRMLGLRLQADLHTLEQAPPSGYSKREALVGNVASSIGRALHTLQDNMAHQGMTNPEHAWFSLQDLCQGTKSSPDRSYLALEKARALTQTVMQRVASLAASKAVRTLLADHACIPPETVGDSAPDLNAECAAIYSAGPVDGCSFLAESEHWDGIDRRWDNDITVPAFVDAFFNETLTNLCDATDLVRSVAAPVDVSHGIPTCVKMHLGCFGKVDDPGTAQAPEPTSGCAAVSGTPPANLGSLSWLLLGIGLALALRSRRSQKPRRTP
jgi:hypothetical protein